MTQDDYIENVPFDALTIGRQARLTRTLTKGDTELFATVTGDVNPAHMDESYAQSSHFHGIIGHGLWTGSLISTLLGNVLPGPGTIYLDQSFTFKKPVKLGDTITAIITVKEKHPDKPIATFDCTIYNEKHEVVLEGISHVLVPLEHIRLPRHHLPHVEIQNEDHYEILLGLCKGRAPLRVGVVHPLQTQVLETVVAAREARLLESVLIGPRARLLEVAKDAGISLDGFEIVDTPHSHASAQTAVAMAAAGDVHAIMKGAIQTHELLEAVVAKDSGLRTGRRMSHAYIMDIATYHKPFLITDAAINIAPSLDEKADICQNAIDLWHAIFGYKTDPKVALLAAVETVTSKMQATLDASALCKMADRGQIKGGILDGPLGFDNAVSREAALEKGIVSQVAGDADIFIAPNLEAANMLAKQLTFLAHAEAAGLVLGAKVPIILTSRADNLRTRLMSCALAVLLNCKGTS
ncbi:MAG: bifunctional enoyl-CoA hydratase/phosphate acetyltransferase [Proteobacteria bacterium]|nr:bifunctional enoyl-CoA hydratase/phosphate acetyltransferase [Pseudomonadota bacterium]